MTVRDDDIERVSALWRELCGAPEAFLGPGVVVIEAVEIRSAPPGAISIVVLGDAAVVSGPGVGAQRDRLGVLDLDALVDRARVEAVLGPFALTLGPAQLWYGHTEAAPRHDVVGPVPVDDPLVDALVAAATEDEVDECSITDVDSGVFVAVDADGTAAAGCGWHDWPLDVAHIGVLTASSHRGRAFGASAAAAALRAASDRGLLPQWRAAAWNEPSIALASRLGLTRVGAQFSVQPR